MRSSKLTDIIIRICMLGQVMEKSLNTDLTQGELQELEKKLPMLENE